LKTELFKTIRKKSKPTRIKSFKALLLLSLFKNWQNQRRPNPRLLKPRCTSPTRLNPRCLNLRMAKSLPLKTQKMQ